MSATDEHAPRGGMARPLAIFAACGAAVFGLVQLGEGVGSGGEPLADLAELGPFEVSPEIEITEALVADLAAQFELDAGRAWTDEERAQAIDRWIDDEILYRAGLARGLDREDPVARRRVIQHLQFVHEHQDPVPEPTRAELEAFMRAHAPRYTRGATLDYEELVVDPRSSENPRLHAAALLARVESGEAPEALPARHAKVEKISPGALSARRGPEFAQQVAGLEEGRWTALELDGAHVIARVTARHTGGELPPLEEIRDQVARDWAEQARARARQSALEDLRAENSTP